MTKLVQGASANKYRELANKIKENLHFENGVISEKNKDLYFDLLPEGIDRKTVEAYARHQNDYINAAHLAAAEIAGEHFKKDKSLARATAEVSLGIRGDRLKLKLDRMREHLNPRYKEHGGDPKVIKAMNINSREIIGGWGLKSLKAEISEHFKSELGL